MKFFLGIFVLFTITSVPFSFGEEIPSLFTETPITSFDNPLAARSFLTDDIASNNNPILYADISIQTSNELQTNLNAFDADKLQLKIFDQEFIVEKQSVTYRGENDFTWFGNIANSNTF